MSNIENATKAIEENVTAMEVTAWDSGARAIADFKES